MTARRQLDNAVLDAVALREIIQRLTETLERAEQQLRVTERTIAELRQEVQS